MTKLRIHLLGPLQVTVGDNTAEFRTDALRVLLAYLAAHQGTPQRRDTLAGLLSPDRSDKNALTYLRNRLTRLRAALGDEQAAPPWFEVDRKQIALRIGADIIIDIIQFEQHMTTVETHAHRQLAGCPTCLARLQAAVELVRGELLAGLNFPSDTWESWLVTQREHYQQRGLEAMTLLREAQMARGAWEAVLAVSHHQLTLEAWMEAAHRATMQAHYNLGDRNAALAQYDQCAQVLWEELGVEPEDETQHLRQQILADALVVTSGADVPDNLPLQTNRFFGRNTEQTNLLHWLVDPTYRLITLVGTGGIGKTRLAIEVGQQIKASFPDGVWFVGLDAIEGNAEQIKIAVGEAAGLAQDDKQLTGDQALAILRDKQMLLIFDNCEVVLEEIAFISEWLKRAPQIAILATSREPLNFAAESVVLLEGLPTGETELRAAEAMFAERGRMARDGFAVSEVNLPQVRHICQLVDGLPLGIALAAAWVRRRSLSQIIDAIDQSIDFLSTRLRDVDPRHRSIRAVFETSWQLLEPETQAVLAALSVFPATFSVEAAEQVAGAYLFDLDALCEKSLLQQQPELERYVMHSLVRQFAGDKLIAHTLDVERAFVDYFYQYARDQQDTYDALQPEWSNFLTAITKAHALEAWQVVLNFVQVLDEPWFRQVRYSDLRIGLGLALEAAIALQDQPAMARTQLRLGEIEIEFSAYQSAEAHLEAAVKHFIQLEDTLSLAQSQYLLGRIKNEQGQDDQALLLFEASKQLFEAEADWIGVAKNLNLIAVCQFKLRQDSQSAKRYLEQAIALQRQVPISARYAESLRLLGRVHLMLEAFDEADHCLSEALEISRQFDHEGEYTAILFEQFVLYKIRQQIDKALTLGYNCLDRFKKQGSLRWEALVKTQLGLLHQAQKAHQQAQVLLNEGLRIFIEVEDSYEQAYSYFYLYEVYAEIGETAESHKAKQRAVALSNALNDAQLKAWLK